MVIALVLFSGSVFALCTDQGYQYGKQVWIDLSTYSVTDSNVIKVTGLNTNLYPGLRNDFADVDVYYFSGATSTKLPAIIDAQKNSVDSNVFFSPVSSFSAGSPEAVKYYVCLVKATETTIDKNVSEKKFFSGVNGAACVSGAGCTYSTTQFISSPTSLKMITSAGGTGWVSTNATYSSNQPVNFNVWIRPTSNAVAGAEFAIGTKTIYFNANNITLGGVASGVGYSDNTWYKAQMSINAKTSDINYKVYDSTGLTIVAQRLNVTGGNIAGTITLSSTNDTTYFDDLFGFSPLQLNAYLDQNNDTNMVSMTIQIPKNEYTANTITPYSIRTIDSSNQEYQLLTTNKIVYWPQNSNKIFVDINATGYFTRRYTFDSNTTITSLQPYLVSTVEGIQTAITVLNDISGSGIGDVTIVSSKLIDDIDTNMESQITDSSGRALFSFYPGDNYYLRYYQNGVLKKTETFSATSSTYTTWLSTQIIFPTIIPPPWIDINYQPSTSFSLGYIIAKDNNFLDLNQMIQTHNQLITSIDVNVFYNFDQNLYGDTNHIFDGNTAGQHMLHQDVNLNAHGFDFNSTVYLFITIVWADGNKQLYIHGYRVIPSVVATACWNGTGAWTNDKMLACWQKWGIDFQTTMPNTINDNSGNLLATTFLALIISLLACLGLFSSVGLDTTNAGFVFVGVLGIFFLFGWLIPELFYLAVFCLIVVLLAKAGRVWS